ncbi:hypothetical protein JXA32_04665 [Candidatus Sumerlaeota bacterium]|nr:hypothetical protein [Candidatus Sumerlaeota bacterium]
MPDRVMSAIRQELAGETADIVPAAEVKPTPVEPRCISGRPLHYLEAAAVFLFVGLSAAILHDAILQENGGSSTMAVPRPTLASHHSDKPAAAAATKDTQQFDLHYGSALISRLFHGFGQEQRNQNPSVIMPVPVHHDASVSTAGIDRSRSIPQVSNSNLTVLAYPLEESSDVALDGAVLQRGTGKDQPDPRFGVIWGWIDEVVRVQCGGWIASWELHQSADAAKMPLFKVNCIVPKENEASFKAYFNRQGYLIFNQQNARTGEQSTSKLQLLDPHGAAILTATNFNTQVKNRRLVKSLHELEELGESGKISGNAEKEYILYEIVCQPVDLQLNVKALTGNNLVF